MVRTYIRKTHSNLSWRRFRRFFSLLDAQIYSQPRLIALWDMYDLSPRRETYIYLDGPLNDGNYSI